MILFRHAQIYDGTDQKPFLGDVLVRNDRIAEVGQNLEVPEDTEILEADSKLRCPRLYRYSPPRRCAAAFKQQKRSGASAGHHNGGFRQLRLLGALSRFLREYAFERHVVTPEDAICKMTFAPAKRFCFTDRGKNRIKIAPRKELYGSLRGAFMFYQRKNGSAHKEADPFFCTK